MDWQTIGAAVGCYLVGSLPFSYLIARLKRIDIRQHGSGNVGATNVTRVVGAGYGALALIGDVGKGVFAAWLTGFLNAPLWLSGLAVVGHNWSLFFKIHWGQGCRHDAWASSRLLMADAAGDGSSMGCDGPAHALCRCRLDGSVAISAYCTLSLSSTVGELGACRAVWRVGADDGLAAPQQHPANSAGHREPCI